jgi:hypothetical protein
MGIPLYLAKDTSQSDRICHTMIHVGCYMQKLKTRVAIPHMVAILQ